MEWEVCKRLLDNGSLTEEEGDQMLREFYARVTGVTVEERLSAVSNETEKVVESVPVQTADAIVYDGVRTVSTPLTNEREIPDTMPDGYTRYTGQVWTGGHKIPGALYFGDSFVCRCSSDAEALRAAWNHHDTTNDPPGFQYDGVPVRRVNTFGEPHRTQGVRFTMPGQNPLMAENLQQARASAWGTYRETQTPEPSLGTLISASDLAAELGVHPQTIGETVKAVSRRLGLDIRRDDRYTGPYYDTAGARSSQRNWKRYRLTPAGRALVEGHLRSRGRIS